MLTRSQVARRIGKSVATVRRLEGTLLFPQSDGSGTRRFNEEEVEAFRRDLEAGRVVLPVGFLSSEGAAPATSTRRRIRELEARIARLERLVARVL